MSTIDNIAPPQQSSHVGVGGLDTVMIDHGRHLLSHDGTDIDFQHPVSIPTSLTVPVLDSGTGDLTLRRAGTDALVLEASANNNKKRKLSEVKDIELDDGTGTGAMTLSVDASNQGLISTTGGLIQLENSDAIVNFTGASVQVQSKEGVAGPSLRLGDEDGNLFTCAAVFLSGTDAPHDVLFRNTSIAAPAKFYFDFLGGIGTVLEINTTGPSVPTGKTMTLTDTPTATTDAANKAYVDSLVGGLNYGEWNTRGGDVDAVPTTYQMTTALATNYAWRAVDAVDSFAGGTTNLNTTAVGNFTFQNITDSSTYQKFGYLYTGTDTPTLRVTWDASIAKAGGGSSELYMGVWTGTSTTGIQNDLTNANVVDSSVVRRDVSTSFGYAQSTCLIPSVAQNTYIFPCVTLDNAADTVELRAISFRISLA